MAKCFIACTAGLKKQLARSARAQQYYKAYLNLRRLLLPPVMKASGLDLPSPLTLKKLDKTDETTIVTLGHRPQALQDRDP